MTLRDRPDGDDRELLADDADSAAARHHVERFLSKETQDSISSIKDINYLKVLTVIHGSRAISRAEIARRLGLSRTTVTEVTKHLLHENVIVETVKGDSKSGRKPVMLELNRTVKVCVGIEIGDSECFGVLTDVYAEPIGEIVSFPIEEQRSGVGWRGEEALLRTYRTLTRALKTGDVFGVSIAIPGIFDARRRTIVVAESLRLENFSVERVESAIGMPVKFINRANAAALGEKCYGVGREVGNLIHVSIADGIGAGIIIDDKLFLGATGSAGEIGHTTIVPNGPLCRCGNYGCLESVVSRNILVARAKDILRSGSGDGFREAREETSVRVDVSSIVELARLGNPQLQKLLEQQGEYIGIALANAVNLFDPNLVLIGGDLGIELGPSILPVIQETVRSRAHYFKEVEIELSSLGKMAGPIGAAAYLIA